VLVGVLVGCKGEGVKVGRCTTMVAAVSGSCAVQADIISSGRIQKCKMMLTLPILLTFYAPLLTNVSDW
jgi:hypothetical protein